MRPVVYLKREGTALLVDRVRYTEVKQEVNKPARALIKAVTDPNDLTVGFGLPMGKKPRFWMEFSILPE